MPSESAKILKCPDPDCVKGKIIVYNVYNEDPLKGEEQDCGLCEGCGYILGNVSDKELN